MKRGYTITRLFAFAVKPQRMSGEKANPTGGQCELTEGLRQLIKDSIAVAKFDDGPEVLFQFEEGTGRKCAMRTAILDCAFEQVIPAGQGAIAIAKRLSRSMDGRSDGCLLVICIETKGKARRATVWIFPKDTAFQFSVNGEESHIDILKDVFSHSSRLRKAARFEGHNNATGFIDGRIVDYQMTSKKKSVASFWIDRFLLCSLSYTSALGTRTMSTALKITLDGTTDTSERTELAQTIAALRQSKQSRWSAQRVANEYLSGDVKDRFLRAMGNEQAQSAVFDLDRSVFDQALNYQVFELESGVFVSSPFKEVDKSVKVTRPKDGNGPTKLKCEGNVKTEKVRARHA
jgi:hypothetical protein